MCAPTYVIPDLLDLCLLTLDLDLLAADGTVLLINLLRQLRILIA